MFILVQKSLTKINKKIPDRKENVQKITEDFTETERRAVL